MTTFLHTADLQLGMKAKDVSDRGQQLREARFNALERMVEIARDEEVDFILIAGDMFEHNQVATRTVSRAVQLLQAAGPIPVYILPGNHDWYDASSVYQRREFSDAQAGNVTVLSTPEPLEATDECTLYPCPLTERRGYMDPTVWIPPRANDGHVRIGVAHGTLPTAAEEPIFPIDPDTPEKKGLDYLALGHTHSLRLYDSNRLAYPGTPEQTTFGDDDPGQVLLVSIEPGRPPDIEPRKTGTLTWRTIEREIEEPAGEALKALREDIENLEDGPNTLVRLRIRGTLGADSLSLLSELDKWLQARCANEQLLHAEVDTDIRTSEELAGALQRLADRDEVIAGTVADLQSLANPEGAAPEGAANVPPKAREELTEDWMATDPPEDRDLSSSDVAQEALAILAEIAGEVE